MGVIQVPGQVSGKNYSVKISGDTPSPTEQERIRQYVAQQEAQFTQQYSQAFGQAPVVDDGTALGRGYELGKAGAYSRLGTATEYLGSGLGLESLAQMGQGMRREGDYEAFLESLRQPAPTRREDIAATEGFFPKVGKSLTYVGEGIGQSIPEMLAPLAASAAGTIAGGPLVGLGAGAAAAFPTFFGGNIQRQEGEVAAGRLAEVDTTAAITAALGQSALNSVADKLLLGGFLKPGQKWLTRSLIGAGEGAVVEAPSEIAQQMLERKQAGLPLDSDDAISEYIDAGILGGIMGGGIRGTTAGLGIGVERQQPITDPTRLLSGPPNDAQTIAAKIIPSADTVTPGPAAANNKTTVQSGGKTVTRVKLSDGAVLEFDTEPTQAQIDGALAQYNASKAAETAPPTAPSGAPGDITVDPDVAEARAYFEERAGIVEEGAQVPRQQAEAQAARETLAYLESTGQIDLPKLRPTVRALRIKAQAEPDMGPPTPPIEAYAEELGIDTRQQEMPLAEPEAAAPAAGAPPAPARSELQQIMDGITGGFAEKGREANANKLLANDPVLQNITNDKILRNIRADPLYNLVENPDGSATIVGVKVNETSPWVGKAPTTEIADAETAQSGPVESDQRGSGDGFERGSEQPSAQPVAGEPDTTPAGAPDVGPVGEAVLGTPEPSVAEGARPDALTPAAPKPLPAKREKQLAPIRDYFTPGNIVESYGGTDRVLSFDVDPNGDWSVTVEPVKQENGQWVPDSRGQPVRTHQTRPDKRRLAKGPILRAAAAPEAAPDALTQRTPVSDEEFVQKVRDAQAEGVRPPAQTLLEADEIAARRATLAEPTAPPMPAPQGPMTGELPGVTTGAAGQVIPSPRLAEPPAGPSPTAPDVAPDTATDRVVARIEEARQHATAMQRLTAWFNKNASADLKLAAQTLPTDRETETLPAADVNAVVSLLETTKDKGTVTPAVAAVRYFGRLADPGYALHAIAYDAAQARGKEGAREATVRTKNTILGTGREPETENDRATLALLEGQGWETAQKAEQWIKDNLSPATYARLVALQSTRANKDRAGYTWIDYGTRSEKRDKVRGATAAGRVGPAQAISEPTVAQVKARAEKVERDREALENAARESRGLTPQQWGALSDAQRQDLVLDYMDLQDMSRGPSAPATPDFLSMPEEAPAAPVRRAIPRRKLTPAQEALEQLRAEIEEAMVESSGPAEVSFSFMAGQTTWPSDSHPRVGQLIRAGDFKGALRALAATAPSPDLRQLATKLVARIGDTQVQVVSPDVMNAIRAELSPETPTLGVETPAGVYVHPRNAAQIAAMRREGHNAAADLVEQYGGQILFNETSPLAPELVLHEAVHAVADAILSNPSHVLTRQMDKLRTNLLKFMPANEYGLSNVRELLTEGMTNPVFRRNLSYVNTEGKKYSAWQEFKQIMRNFLRNIMGRPSVKPDTALTTLDRALDAVLASNPNEMQVGSIAGASFAPGASASIVKKAYQNARVPTAADIAVLRSTLRNKRIPVEWKGTLLRWAVPLDYVADMAAPYLPSARRAHDLLGQHQRAIREGVERVVETTEATAQVLTKYARDQQKIDDFNDTAYAASRLQVDPRKDESAYKGYSYQYNVLDKDGNIVRRVESQRFKTETERNRALQAYNARLTPQQKANRIARATVAFNETAEMLADHKRLRAKYLAMPKDLQVEFSRMLEMQPAVGKGWIDAIRERIEAYVPNDKAVQNKIFNNIYNKILSGRLLDPYLAFSRSGQFRLSYRGVDPLTVTVDPVTGAVDMSNAEVTEFKHSFDTASERQDAIKALIALPASNQISDINPYEDGTSGYSRQEIPLDFVSKVLSAIDDSGALAAIVDPQSGATKDLREQVINLVLDSVPESSFINSFKKRQGIRGFRGDVTPISEPKSAGDVLKNMRESATRIAQKTADLKYGAQFATVRKELNEQNMKFQNNNPLGLSVLELDRQRAEVAQYATLLTDFTRSPFNVRAKYSRLAGAGTYMLTLGFNVSTALVTLSQIPLFVYPVLAGKYSDMRAVGAIGAANRILAKSGRERTFERIGPDGQIETGTKEVRLWEHSTEYNTSPYLAPLIEYAKKNGVFNRSLMQDELMGMQPSFAEKVAAATGILQHQSERYSRETALNAAYILELQDLTGNQNMSVGDFVRGLEAGTLNFTPEQAQAAAESAVNVSEKSNGPIYAAAGPLASQGNFTSLIYMFKRHPIAMMNLLAQTASRGMGSTDPADRRIAQRQLARMFGSLAIFSGALGLPLMQQIGWMYDLFADDDEPDFKSAVRMTLGEGGSFGLIDYLTGMRISERIGMGAAIYRPGFASQDAAPLFQAMEGLGGPVLGMLLKYTSGRQLEDLQNGDYQRFAEGIMPTSIANFFKAVRFATEGAETRRGDMIDDIGPFHIAAQAFGFMPASFEQQLAMNSLGTRINNAINQEKSRIMQRIHRAREEGDFEEVSRLMEQVQEFNARNPRNRIDGPTLEKSRIASQRVTAQTSNGLYVSPQNRARVQQYLDAYGPSSIGE
jgi:hypothetical protein